MPKVTAVKLMMFPDPWPLPEPESIHTCRRLQDEAIRLFSGPQIVIPRFGEGIIESQKPIGEPVADALLRGEVVDELHVWRRDQQYEIRRRLAAAQQSPPEHDG